MQPRDVKANSPLVSWVEEYLYRPTPLQRLISYLLYPLSLLYCSIVWFKHSVAIPKRAGVPVVSIGNLIVGGSGKTPFTVELARRYYRSAIVLRGYGRSSKGCIVVSNGEDINVNVDVAGDEAMLYAKSLPDNIVVVSENRTEGIEKAISLGARVVFLDDGYSKHHIEKLDIILQSSGAISSTFCLPAGPYRERLWRGKNVLELTQDREFFREVAVEDSSEKLVLVTAISKPWRLDSFLPSSVVEKQTFADHHLFKKEELESILKESGAKRILTTSKDAVKMENYGLPITIMKLSIKIDESVLEKIERYIKTY